MTTEKTVSPLLPDAPAITRLDQKIDRVIDQTARITSDNAVKVGRYLLDIKAQLQHGHWLTYLKGKKQISADSAERFMGIAAFEADHPAAFQALRRLGYSKISALLRLPRKVMLQAVTLKKLTIPGTRRSVTLDDVTVIELHHLINLYLGKPAFDPEQAKRKMIRGMGSWDRNLDELLKHPEAKDPEYLSKVEKKLVKMLKKVRAQKAE